MWGLVLLLVLGWVGTASAQRVDFYDKRGHRTGYAIMDPKTGRVDVFDKYSQRKGYGQVAPSPPPLSVPPPSPAVPVVPTSPRR